MSGIPLSARDVDRFEVPESRSQIDIYDPGCTGLVLRVGRKRKTWFIRYRAKGQAGAKVQVIKLAVCTGTPDMKAIRREARQKIAEIEQGADLAAAKRAAKTEMTFGDLAAEYMNHVTKYNRELSIRDDRRYLALYIPEDWRGRRLSTFGRGEVEALHSALHRTRGVYPANHCLRLLRSMFNRAREWEMLKGDNPATGVRLLPETRRSRYLSREEIGHLLSVLAEVGDWRWRAYFSLILMLGKRKSEMLRARWADINLAEGLWKIGLTKNGQPDFVVLPSQVVKIMAALPSKGASEWVFPGDRAGQPLISPHEAWKRIRAKAGISDCTIHDLRHTNASWMVGQGSSLALVSQALNHLDSATSHRYVHSMHDAVRAAKEQTVAAMLETRVAHISESKSEVA
jgi:integrase